MSEMTTPDAARQYLASGYKPIPIPPRRKGPTIQGWTSLRVTESEISSLFRTGDNIGLLLGEPSGWLVDVDIDAPEALRTVPSFLPTTGRCSGREGNSKSHWWYRAAGAKTRKFQDPMRPSQDGMLVEIRSTGAQTVVPPSIHPDGPTYEWESEGEPAELAPSALEAAVATGAASALLARYWPGKGQRNEASLALAGMLIQGGWQIEQVEHFVFTTAMAAGDEEAHSRAKNAIATGRAADEGRPTTGAPTLAKSFDGKVVRAVRDWLGLKSAVASTPWPEPTPIPAGVAPVPVFNPELLPDALRPWLMDAAERQQAPLDFFAIAALVAAGSIIGRSIGIRPRQQDDWTVIPNLWGGAVGAPSSGKSPAVSEALAPLNRLANDARKAHEVATIEAKTQQAYRQSVSESRAKAAKAKIDKLIKEGKEPDESLLAEFRIVDDALPKEPRYLTSDPTVEALGELLAANPRGILIHRDELLGFLRNLEREDRRQDRAAYLEFWSGLGSYTYDRIGRGTVHIEAACVSILGTIQPGPLSSYVWGAIEGGLEADGLLQRFQLLVWPDLPTEYRTVDRSPDFAARDRAFAVFRALAEMDPLASGAQASPTLPFLRFTPEAQPIFSEWHKNLMEKLRAREEHPALESHFAKYPKLVPALALIIHLIDSVEGGHIPPVPKRALLHALAMADYLEAHARRIYGQAVAPELHAAQILFRRLDRVKKDPFSARDVANLGWMGLHSAEAVTGAAEVLADYGWLRPERTEAGLQGGRPTIRWHRHPSLQGGEP